MKRNFTIILLVAALAMIATAFAGCEKSYRQKSTDKVETAEKKVEDAKKEADEKAKEPDKKPAPAKTAAVDDVDCWGVEDAKAAPVAFEANGQKYEITNGYFLKAVGAAADKPLVIGVVTDIKTNIESNMKNLEGFFADFKKAGVSAVFATGDVAEDYDKLKSLFEFFGKKGLPTFAIVGNRDKKADFVKAISEVNAKYNNVINMNRIRVVDLGAATFVSLPGYYDTNFIHHGPGCAYKQTHVDKVKELVGKAKNPVVLVSHGPPRGVGKDAIDNAVEAGNVGDPKLTKLVADARIPFGLFGNIHEAGGKAVGPDFKTVLAEGQSFQQLYLNPGPSDSDPWKMNDGSISRGMAGIVTFKDGKASYQILRVK